MSEVRICPKCSEGMEIGYLRDAPWWRRGRKMLKLGFGPRVSAHKCETCGYIELYAEK